MNIKYKSAESLLLKLVNKVAANLAQEQNLGLLTGLSGQLLFLTMAEQSIPGIVDTKLLQEQFNRLQLNLASQSSDISLSAGIAGIGLMFELVQEAIGDNTDINLTIDECLIKRLAGTPWQGEYELLRGLSGFLLYAVFRKKSAKGKILLDAVLTQLLNRKLMLGDGVAWATEKTSIYQLNSNNDIETNLGLAHGNTGTLRVLTMAYQQYPSIQLKSIIHKHSTWLLSQGIENIQGSCFGYYSGDTRQSRLAWCYGDLSNSLVLWHAGKALNDPHIMNRARNIALLSAKRRMKTSGVTDMGLCHGASGNAILFSTLYSELGEQSLHDASNYWFSLLFNSADSENDLCAYWMHNCIENKYVESFSLLEGYPGIGLALLSQLGFNTSWKTCLLMD
jgi:hypothetical protein